MRRNKGKLNLSRFRKRQKQFMVLVPSVHSCLCDLVRQFQLCVQIRCVHVAWQIRRTIVLPAVFINLTSVIFASVRSLFPDDLGIFNIFFIPDQNSAAFSHAEILRLMEAETAELAEGAKRLSFIRSHDPLCGIFHHRQAMPPRNVHDHIHLTANPGIVHRCDCLRPLRYGLLDQCLVYVHGVRPDIHEDRLRPAQYKSVCRGHESIGRQDHLVSLPDIRQQRRQFRGVGTGRGQQTFLRAGLLLDPLTAFLRKRPVAANLLILDGLLHIFDFLTRKRRNIKIDHSCFPP